MWLFRPGSGKRPLQMLDNEALAAALERRIDLINEASQEAHARGMDVSMWIVRKSWRHCERVECCISPCCGTRIESQRRPDACETYHGEIGQE